MCRFLVQNGLDVDEVGFFGFHHAMEVYVYNARGIINPCPRDTKLLITLGHLCILSTVVGFRTQRRFS